jgi:putative nucleotidyltransferase with HDIG domain
MREVVGFLTGFAQAISTMTLYEEGHPARERALDAVYDALMRLQEVEPTPHLTFLGDEILLGSQPVRALKTWDWGSRLSQAGIQRLEFLGPVTREDLDAFLEEAFIRVTGAEVPSAEVRQGRPSQIRYGTVGLREESGEGGAGEVRDIETATLRYDLKDEVEAVEWIHNELKGQNRLNLLEAEAIVRSLTVAMHGDQEFVIPLLRLKRFDQYTTTHAMNVSILTMALAEYIGLGPNEVRTFGTSGLLHDLGKVTIPDEILNKPGRLTDQERAVMNGHTVEGARIILETEEHLDLAAVVAYEHHIKIDGGGYPSLRYHRKCHSASDLVHVCDVYDALRTHRPYRDAWAQEKVLSYLEEHAGKEFDPDLTRAFVRMMRTWDGRIAYIERPDQPIEPTGTGAETNGGASAPSEPPESEPESAAGGTESE